MTGLLAVIAFVAINTLAVGYVSARKQGVTPFGRGFWRS